MSLRHKQTILHEQDFFSHPLYIVQIVTIYLCVELAFKVDKTICLDDA